jgi:hypothetical protein
MISITEGMTLSARIRQAIRCHSAGSCVGVLAHYTGWAGWTISNMDRLAISLLGDIKGSFRLVVQ